MLDGFVCACCGRGIYDLESAETTDKKTGRRYVICFDCADRYTSAQALELIKRRYEAKKSTLKNQKKKGGQSMRKPTRQEIKAQANRAYKAMNTLLFDGALEDIDIKLSNAAPIRNGFFGFYQPYTGNIYLRESLVTDLDTTDLINELFHEMIHKYNHEIAHVSDYINGYHTHEFLEAVEQHGGFFVDEIPDEEIGYNNIELRRDVFFKIFDAI